MAGTQECHAANWSEQEVAGYRDARPQINESREQMLFRQGLFCRFMAAVRYMPQPGIGRQ